MNIKPQYRIVLIYLIVGIAWIFLSDILVNAFFAHKDDVAMAQNIKGWLFIIITGTLLYFLIRRDMHRITKLNTQLINSYDQTITGDGSRSWIYAIRKPKTTP